MYNIAANSMAGDKYKSLYFYHAFACVIYLSEYKWTQAMPFELLSLECQVHKGTGWCWDEWSDCLCLSKVRPGSFCKKNPTNIDPKLQAGSIQVVLSLEARTTMFSLPYRSVAKFPRKKKKVLFFFHTSGWSSTMPKRSFCFAGIEHRMRYISQTL